MTDRTKYLYRHPDAADPDLDRFVRQIIEILDDGPDLRNPTDASGACVYFGGVATAEGMAPRCVIGEWLHRHHGWGNEALAAHENDTAGKVLSGLPLVSGSVLSAADLIQQHADEGHLWEEVAEWLADNPVILDAVLGEAEI